MWYYVGSFQKIWSRQHFVLKLMKYSKVREYTCTLCIQPHFNAVAIIEPKVWCNLRDHSQTLVRGAWCKKNYCKNFAPPPSDSNISWPSFLPWKLWVNPIANSIFTGKFVVFFFSKPPPLTRVKNLRSSPFCIKAPPTRVCKRSLRLLPKVLSERH